jgi:predicted nucleotidyltransferase
VEFEPEHVPGFIALHEMEDELSNLLGGRRVDLVTERSPVSREYQNTHSEIPWAARTGGA